MTIPRARHVPEWKAHIVDSFVIYVKINSSMPSCHLGLTAFRLTYTKEQTKDLCADGEKTNPRNEILAVMTLSPSTWRHFGLGFDV